MSEENAAPAPTPKPVESDNGLKAMTEEMDKVRDQLSEVIKQRDGLKKTQDDEKAARLAEQGEFQQLAENRGTEVKTLQEQLDALNGTISTYQERDEAKLKTLLESVPENLRETVATNSGTLAEKLDLAEKLAEVKPQGPGARPAGTDGTKTFAEEVAGCKTTAELNAVKSKYGHY